MQAMRNRFTNLGWAVTLVIAVIPIVLWLTTQPTHWETPSQIYGNLGKLFGLAGLALFAWNVILSARLKIYDKLFLGLDNMYRAHHLIGCWTIILLMIHPMLLVMRYLVVSPVAAYEFIAPSAASPFRMLGSLTLLAMMAVMFLVLYINVRYKIFIMLQRILGALLFVGGIHALFVGGSDINSLLGLQIYIIGLLVLAAGVYVYRSLFHGGLHKFYPYTLKSVTPKGDITELQFVAEDAAIAQQPGQFAFIKFDTKGVLAESHPFTISAPPKPGTLRFSIKNLGDYTGAVAGLKPGATAKIDGPYGTFSNRVITNPRQVWVAGGIGITPFLAMAGSLGKNQKVDLYYSTKTAAEAVYLPELMQATKTRPNLRLIPFVTEREGFLTVERIFSTSQQLEGAAFLVCGPPAMMQALRKQLRAKGVANNAIHTEEFKLK
jgi:predicted ferric reductase